MTRVERSITVRRPVSEVYAFWRRFENLPKFMVNVLNVEEHGRHSQWTVRGPGGQTVAWNAETIDDALGRRLAWRSTEASDVHVEGTVSFLVAPGDRGTESRQLDLLRELESQRGSSREDDGACGIRRVWLLAPDRWVRGRTGRVRTRAFC